MKRALLVVGSSVLSCLAACSTPSDGRGEAVGKTAAAVIDGEDSDKSQDSVVLLVHYDPSKRSEGIGQCTGTLLAPRLVLTARHCVANTDPYAACSADGTPLAAGVVRDNHDADTMYVFTGSKRPDFYRGDVEPAGIGEEILDDGGKNLCNHDIALIVLKDPIEGVPISPIRLDEDVSAGEEITAVGWGVTDQTASPTTRQQRKDVKIVTVGPNKKTGSVPPNEFEVGESICSGDSGGPAFDQKTEAVVGVVSRGGNASGGGDESDPAANCINGKNLYTKVSPFKELILQAYERAGAEPWFEGGPDPRKAKAKEECSTNDDCRSALCLEDPDADGALTCAEDCSATETCSVEGDVCTSEGDAKVCRAPKPPPATKSGCSSSPSSPAPLGGLPLAIVFGAVALSGLRRRRSSAN